MDINMKLEALMAKVSTKQLVEIVTTLEKTIDNMCKAGKIREAGDQRQARRWILEELERREPEKMAAYYDSDDFYATVADFITF